MFSFGGILLLAAALLATPGAGWAAHGGGHFGGGHFGGAYLGGYRGGFYGGGLYHGYHHYYPYYGLYGYDPSYYATYPYAYTGPVYDSSYYGPAGGLASADADASVLAIPAAHYAPSEPDTRAHVTAHVPAGARLWFDDTATTSTGPTREFSSPPLTPDRKYTYEVRARWNENGREVTQTQTIAVSAAAHVNLTFPLPPTTAGQAAAAKKG
jgi:uncharacterized protein (TIGR03000 family)